MTPDFIPPGYRTLRLLGSGQTSHVYLAEHAQRGQLALKLPRAGLQARPALRRMFENEVQITLSLKHPHTVEALDGYPTGAKAFLALEYCPGGTLDRMLLEGGKPPLTEAFRLVLDVGKGLEHCHKHQVLHRDVKPANVFLTENSSAKLGDFGTGMFLTEQNPDRVGTAFYMAPEIFGGEGASVKSDIYSLGVLAYEVIAGTRPFDGESYDALMMAHLSSLPKPLRHHRKELSPEVVRVIANAMSRDPHKRYDSVKAFNLAFSQAAEVPLAGSSPVQAPSVGRASRSKVPEDTSAADTKPSRGWGRWFGRKRE